MVRLRVSPLFFRLSFMIMMVNFEINVRAIMGGELVMMVGDAHPSRSTLRVFDQS
jgi:hypothetical protein